MWTLTVFLNQPVLKLEKYHGSTNCDDYGGEQLHVMQVGLGTFATFLHSDTYWMDVLLEASTQRKDDPLRGIGVDPVEESVVPFEHLAWRRSERYVSAVLAAVGEQSGSVALYCLPYMARYNIRRELESKGLNWVKRAKVDRTLAYLENMSSVDVLHPDFEDSIEYVRRLSGTKHPLLEKRNVPVFSFHEILERHNSSGCEILIIDAEGADVAILRSMINACKFHNISWPRVIRFETRGLADVENDRTEELMVQELQSWGYLLLAFDDDATLVDIDAMRSSNWVAWWADKHFTLKCCSCGAQLAPSQRNYDDEIGTSFTQWRRRQSCSNQSNSWCCRPCTWPKYSSKKRAYDYILSRQYSRLVQ